MKVQDIIHGFEIKQVRRLPELEGCLWEMEHRKTGAQLCWLDRRDENKTFSIAFKTLPEDSTGVFHILEHSVLCGSDKYPVKEPFVELLKSSVRTFLNAITFPDKTVYPVSTRNDRDLLNLMDVYLDAVFHPSIYNKSEIFRQEGWRFEGEGKDLRYQGVVFNEMKGSFANPETVLENEMSRLLFPDNCYRHVSGGDPACIPELTYEQFLANHRKYYHPSNARIGLVGSIRPDEVLAKLDSFLSAYDRQPAAFDIPMQEPVPAAERTVAYEIGADEDPAAHTVICCGALLGTFAEKEKSFAASVLSDYLTGDDDAPLKRAVLDAGLAQDFAVSLHDGMQQNWVSWDAWNTEAEHLEALRKIVRDALSAMVREGLDRERLAACFHRCAFQMRDREGGFAPRSLMEAIGMLDTWLYGGDPALGLTVDRELAALEARLETGWFEDLIRTLFLENEHLATLVLVPSGTLGREKARQERERLLRQTAGWTEADLARQAEQAEALRLWQQTPDSEEALASIPMLQLSDLKEEIDVPMPELTELAGVRVLRHDLNSRLVYLRANFEASDLEPEQLPDLAVLCRLLGSMGTARHSRSRLPLEIKNEFGSLDFAPTVLPGTGPDRCRVLLTASAACLADRTGSAAALLGEILTETAWEDRTLLRDALQQIFMNARISLPARGHQYGFTRVSSGLTARGTAMEYTSGLSFAARIKEMSACSEEELDAVLARLADMARRLFTRRRLTLSASRTAPDEALSGLLSALPEGEAAPTWAAYAPAGVRQEGVVIPAAVGFAVTGTNFKLHDRAYSGSIPVLANILNFVYLWSRIRVQGGAYGCGFMGRTDGEIGFYTYRDPQPARSLQIVRQAADFLRGFCAEKPDLTGYILSSVSALDPLLSSPMKMAAADTRWFSGIRAEDVRGWYRQMLGTDCEALLALLPALEDVAADNCVCVVAGKDLLDACGEGIKSRISL